MSGMATETGVFGLMSFHRLSTACTPNPSKNLSNNVYLILIILQAGENISFSGVYISKQKIQPLIMVKLNLISMVSLHKDLNLVPIAVKLTKVKIFCPLLLPW